jgi:hypothetical protein
MMRLQFRFVERLAATSALCALAASAAACSAATASTDPGVGVSKEALTGAELLKQCGLVCPGDTDDKGVTLKGIADGNAAISGSPSVDAFFASVIHFQGAATGVAGSIHAQLDAIRGDFGIAADADLAAQLKTQLTANLDGTLKVDAEPAKCEADMEATLQAQARCDADFKPGSVMVECKGGCDVDVSADVKCDADADLECTITPPDLKCSGSCQGSCTTQLTAAATCSGTCTGSCSGNCSAYVKDSGGAAQCAGQCDGMCMGKCDVQLAAKASCMGECRGECTLTNPQAGCKGAVRATCRAKGNASIKCDGKCDADIEPPMARAECQASAKAEAKINVQCTPPRLAVTYKLKAGVDAMAQARFSAALKTLINVRLPALNAEIKRGQTVRDAGAGLVASASGAVSGAFTATVNDANSKLSLKTKFGLGCALKELPKVEAVVSKATTDLSAQLKAAGDLTQALNVSS